MTPFIIRNKIPFMKSVSNFVKRILCECWGFIFLVLVSSILKNEESKKSIFNICSYKSFIRNINSEDEINFDNVGSHNKCLYVLWTQYLITSIFSLLSLLFIMICLLAFPYYFRIASYLSFPVVTYMFSTTIGLKTQYIIPGVILATLFSVYMLYTTFFHYSSKVYTSSKMFLDKISKEDYSFFFILIFQYFLILFDILILRLTDIKLDQPYKYIIFVIFMAINLNIVTFSLRSNLVLYFSSKKIASFTEKSPYEFIVNYFKSRVFAIAEVPIFLFNLFDRCFYRPFYGIPENIVTLFENNRSYTFYSTMTGKSVLYSFLISTKQLWGGKLRETCRSVNLHHDILPSSLFIICFHFYLQNSLNIFTLKFHEVFFIYYSHFYIICELLNSHVVVESFRENYGLINLRNDVLEVSKFER